MAETLAVNRQLSKRSAADTDLGHRFLMATTRKLKKKREPKTPLQAMFQRRLTHELKLRNWSVRKLGLKSAEMNGAPPRTFNDVMNGADPRLETVYWAAMALQMHPCDLLRDPEAQVPREDANAPERRAANVSRFPTIPSIFGQKAQAKVKRKVRRTT